MNGIKPKSTRTQREYSREALLRIGLARVLTDVGIPAREAFLVINAVKRLWGKLCGSLNHGFLADIADAKESGGGCVLTVFQVVEVGGQRTKYVVVEKDSSNEPGTPRSLYFGPWFKLGTDNEMADLAMEKNWSCLSEFMIHEWESGWLDHRVVEAKVVVDVAGLCARFSREAAEKSA